MDDELVKKWIEEDFEENSLFELYRPISRSPKSTVTSKPLPVQYRLVGENENDRSKKKQSKSKYKVKKIILDELQQLKQSIEFYQQQKKVAEDKKVELISKNKQLLENIFKMKRNIQIYSGEIDELTRQHLQRLAEEEEQKRVERIEQNRESKMRAALFIKEQQDNIEIQRLKEEIAKVEDDSEKFKKKRDAKRQRLKKLIDIEKQKHTLLSNKRMEIERDLIMKKLNL